VNADKFFDGIIALSRIIVDQRVAERKRKKEASTARRKARYAARKAAGTLPKRVKSADVLEPPYEPHTNCYCQHTIPPCSWCTDGPNVEDE